MTELMVSTETASQLKKVADMRGTTAEELAERAIRQFLRAEAREVMRQESEAFRKMHADLLVKYPNQYVAIHQKKVVDHDIDQLALLKRVDDNLPDTPVLIKQVLTNPEEVYTIRSPRLDRE